MIFIGICIIIGSVIIASQISRKNDFIESQDQAPFNLSKEEMAQIIKRDNPIEDFLNETQKENN